MWILENLKPTSVKWLVSILSTSLKAEQVHWSSQSGLTRRLKILTKADWVDTGSKSNESVQRGSFTAKLPLRYILRTTFETTETSHIYSYFWWKDFLHQLGNIKSIKYVEFKVFKVKPCQYCQKKRAPKQQNTTPGPFSPFSRFLLPGTRI